MNRTLVLLTLAILIPAFLSAYAQNSGGDSAVQAVADEFNLSSVVVTNRQIGTYWEFIGDTPLPMPCPPLNSGFPIYNIVGNNYLVDASKGDYLLGQSLILEQAVAVSNLIVRVQNQAAQRSLMTNGMMSLAGSGSPPFPGGGTNAGGGGYAPAYGGITWDTNQLWLELTNVRDGIAYLNAHNATDEVYAVRAATNLLTPFNQWAIARDFWPTADTTNLLPFTVGVEDGTAAFYRLEDWTGITHGNNLVPDWYFWENFGTTDWADTDWDASGTHTLLYDFTNGLDPNPISFSLPAANLYVHTTGVTVPLNLTTGLPSEYAWLVNATNFDAAVWQPFSTTNVPVTLGGGDGMYNVLVGLRKSPADSQPAWASVLLTLDTTPPVITLTNPVGVLSQPLIQLQGYANETLSRLTYAVSNAAGVFTNQTAYLLGQAYDTNLAAFTENYFQAYDVAVTNGENRITLRAYDLADNETTVSYDYNVVFSTNPPVLSLIWPPPQARIGGSVFTLRAAVADATAKVTATIEDTNGITHAVSALVERNGNVWAANLPLSAGTNVVTLAATNAAGAVNTTNFIVVQSDVSLTIDPLSAGQLNQPAVDVTGTVSDPAQGVWVNGVAASVAEDGDWEADDVPINDTGTADLQAQAGTDTNNPVSEQTFRQDQPTVVRVVNYTERQQTTIHTVQHCSGAIVGDLRIQEIDYWTRGAGGTMETVDDFTQVGGGDINEHTDNATPWAADEPPLPPWPYAQASAADYWLAPGECSSAPVPESETTSDTARTLVQVATTGPAASGNRLVRLLLTATDDNDNHLSPDDFTLQGQAFTPTADDAGIGELYTVVPNGSTPAFTPAGAYDRFHFTLKAQDVALQIFDANTTNDLSTQTNTVIVGQPMNLFAAVADTNNNIITNVPLQSFQWSVPGYAISNFVVAADSSTGTVYTNFATDNANVKFYWADGDTNWSHPATRIVQCSATVNGKTITGQAVFNVLKPKAKITTHTTSVGIFTQGNYQWLFFDSYSGPGIIFSNTIETPSNFQGSAVWVQIDFNPILKYIDTNSISHTNSQEGISPYLDTTYPYVVRNENGYPVDTPGLELPNGNEYKEAYDSDTFEMWMMFQPTNGIPVPLRAVNWSWSGTATNFQGILWELKNETNSVKPSDFPTLIFPQWRSNVTNAFLLPPVNYN